MSDFSVPHENGSISTHSPGQVETNPVLSLEMAFNFRHRMETWIPVANVSSDFRMIPSNSELD